MINLNLRNIIQKSAKQFGKVCLGLGLATGASIVQGSYFITRYRLNHGEAPHPITPSRGTVVVSLNETQNDTQPREIPNKPPLKIFVVGDSLAVGCGVSRSTPVLPESIARHLARELGRPVRWSCVGKPGASTEGIMMMLHKWFNNNGESSKENASDNASDHDYDVVVVLAGMNDIKDTLLPFLAYERSNLTFVDGLKSIFGVLRGKLRLDNEHIPFRNSQHLPKSRSHPLVVLPALPTNAIPVLCYPPIGLIANSVIDYMDRAKQKLSQEYPDKILFVEAPSASLIRNIEKGTSRLCFNFSSERYLLALRDIKSEASMKIERLMREHLSAFERNDDCEAEMECEQALYSHIRPEIPVLGSSLVSYDSIHPNEKGYDYWGRHIAAAIVDEWRGTAMNSEHTEVVKGV
mmetsp:Transcript_4201/g.9417  ORF Transcript_4201/g.9417 Transcript_4201/m.9417 type:complete len:407 (+) Transcript_4201:281-1501(+)